MYLFQLHFTSVCPFYKRTTPTTRLLFASRQRIGRNSFQTKTEQKTVNVSNCSQQVQLSRITPFPITSFCMQKLIGSAESVHPSIYSFFVSVHGGIGIPLESSHISTAKAALIKILNENIIANLFVYIGGCMPDCVPPDKRLAKLTCVECGGMDCIYLGYDTLQCRIFVNTAVKLWVPKRQIFS